jgi:hypothetical protein
MACYHPITAWRSKNLTKSGKRGIVFSANEAQDARESLEIPCGQCIGCRLERSRQWAVRCVHEASLYQDNCFITLTFDDESLLARPNPYSLDVRDFQLFMKKLRKKYGSKIRYFHCGEYGDQTSRPHYHACLFNFRPPDLVHIRNNSSGDPLYSSESLARIWGNGHVWIGELTFESAAYVARYVLKKVNGKQQQQIGENGAKHYEWIHPETGELLERKPEYTTMSRRPGIAADWFKKYSSDLYPKDFVTMRGVKQRPAKFYDRKFEEMKPLEFEKIKSKREELTYERVMNNTPERLGVRETIQKLRAKKLVRPDN